MENAPLVSIIIANYNGRHLLKRCLDSVCAQTYGNLEVIAVDNGSTDGSLEFIKQHYPRFKTIANRSNFGFAKAINQGIEVSGGEFVAVLNNDTQVEPTWIINLIRAIQSDPGVGSCASKQINFFQRDIIDSAGIQLHRGGYPISRGSYQKDRGQFDTKQEVLGAHGASAFYRRQMLAQIGMFDSDYFLYNEEFDLSLRARMRGWKCMYVPDAIVYHMGGETLANANKKLLIYYMERNRLFSIIKNFPLKVLFYDLPYLLKYELDIGYRLLTRLEAAPILARIDVAKSLLSLFKKRRKIQQTRLISDQEFKNLILR